MVQCAETTLASQLWTEQHTEPMVRVRGRTTGLPTSGRLHMEINCDHEY